jgi:hypothetical protein
LGADNAPSVPVVRIRVTDTPFEARISAQHGAIMAQLIGKWDLIGLKIDGYLTLSD